MLLFSYQNVIEGALLIPRAVITTPPTTTPPITTTPPTITTPPYKKLPKNYKWDYDNLNELNESLKFNINAASDPTHSTADKFIEYLINEGVPYDIYQKPPPNPSFPPYGQGVCMTDWDNVTDTTNNVSGLRTVRMRDGTVLMNSVDKVNGLNAYNQCLQFAQEQKQQNPSINVFSIQAGGACLVGDTNYLALNSNVVTTDKRTTNQNQVGKLNNPDYCKLPGTVPGTEVTVRPFPRYTYESRGWEITFKESDPGPSITINEGKEYARTNGSNWTQMVYAYPLPTPVYRFDEKIYSNQILTYIERGIVSYSAALNSNKLNFTTMEGYVNYRQEPRPVGIPITDMENIPGLDDNILKKLKDKNFKVTAEEYEKWITQLVENKILIDTYLTQVTDFELFSEDAIYGFLTDFKTLFNMPSDMIKNPSIILKVINVLKPYQIKNLTDYKEFSEIVTLLGLNNQPISLLEVLDILLKINVHCKDYKQFFGIWQTNNTSTNDTMYIIMNILTTPTFNYQYNGDDSQLSDLITFAKYSTIEKTFTIPTTRAAFIQFNELLNKMDITYQAYVGNFNTLQKIVGPQKNLQQILPKFSTYYNTVAYSDSPEHILDDPVTLSTLLNDFIYVIDPVFGSTKPPYFTACGGDLSRYFEIVTTVGFTVNDIKSHKEDYNSPTQTNTGNTFCKFMIGYGNGNVESFDTYGHVDQTENIISMAYKYIARLFESVLGDSTARKQIEGAVNISDNIAFQRFFKTTTYRADYNSLVSDLEKRGLNGSDNVSTFINSYLNTGLFYSDYLSVCQIFDRFNDNVQMSIQDIQSILVILSSIGVVGLPAIISFIETIREFGVSYKINFNTFVDDFIRFSGSTNPSSSTNAVTMFIEDMTMMGYTYATPAGINSIQTIIQFFLIANLHLEDYYYGESSTKQIKSFNKKNVICKTTYLPANLPHLFIKSLYDYNKNARLNYYDMLILENFQNVEHCDIINAIQEAFMLTSPNYQIISERQAIIIPNMTTITSFFYKEEIDILVRNSSHYGEIEKRILLMNEVANGMIKYSYTFKGDRQNDFDLYNDIITFLKLFPILSFQYFSNEFAGKCVNGQECFYDIYVDPIYSECKASTSDKTINYRANPPIL